MLYEIHFQAEDQDGRASLPVNTITEVVENALLESSLVPIASQVRSHPDQVQSQTIGWDEDGEHKRVDVAELVAAWKTVQELKKNVHTVVKAFKDPEGGVVLHVREGF